MKPANIHRFRAQNPLDSDADLLCNKKVPDSVGFAIRHIPNIYMYILMILLRICTGYRKLKHADMF